MKKFLRPDYVADLMGVSVETLADWRYKTKKTNKLHGPPYINMGGKWGKARYPEEEFKNWQNGLNRHD